MRARLSLSLSFFSSIQIWYPKVAKFALSVFSPQSPASERALRLESGKEKRQRERDRERAQKFFYSRETREEELLSLSLSYINNNKWTFLCRFSRATCRKKKIRIKDLRLHVRRRYYNVHLLSKLVKTNAVSSSSLSRPELGETVGGAGKHDVFFSCRCRGVFVVVGRGQSRGMEADVGYGFGVRARYSGRLIV